MSHIFNTRHIWTSTFRRA